MALGELVKSLVVRFSADNYELVKAEIDSIPDEKTVTIKYERSDFNQALMDLAALGRSMDSLERQFGGGAGGGGFFSQLFGGFGNGPAAALGGILGTPVVGPVVLGGLIFAVGALVSEVDALASGFAGAAQGALAFGALAYPTFSAVTGAVTAINTDTAAYQSATTAAAKSTALAKIKADWAALDPVQKTAVKNVLALQSQFDTLATNFESALAPLLNTVLGKNGILSQIIADLPPFANAFAKALGPLLTQFDKFLSSPGAQKFQDQMLAIEKLAVPAIGQGIGQVALAIGKLLTIFSAKDDARAIRLAFDIITGAINGVTWAIKQMKTSWDWITQVAVPALVHAFDNVKHAWDNVSHAIDNLHHAFDNIGHAFSNIMHAIGNFNHAIDNVRHFIAVAGGDISHFFTVDVPRWIGIGVKWWQGLPGRIISAIGNLAGQLFSSGVHWIQALINGLNSQIGPLLATVGRIASIIAGHFPNSPAKYGPFSGIGAPEKRGEHISWALSQGMLSGLGYVSMASSVVAGAAAGGLARGAGRGYARGGGDTYIFNVAPLTDPHKTAVEIQRMLLSLKRRRFGQGNTGAGLGLA